MLGIEARCSDVTKGERERERQRERAREREKEREGRIVMLRYGIMLLAAFVRSFLGSSVPFPFAFSLLP